MHGAPAARRPEDGGPVDSDDTHAGQPPPYCQADRPADQADPHDGDPTEGSLAADLTPQIVRPIAGAMMRSCAISSANCSG